MKQTAEILALQQAGAICDAHRVGLTDALSDLGQRSLTEGEI
jgi:hypothetical protein